MLNNVSAVSSYHCRMNKTYTNILTQQGIQYKSCDICKATISANCPYRKKMDKPASQ